jgi:hypothetical protein
MTISDDDVPTALRATDGLTHELQLTEEEILTAVWEAAAAKVGLGGVANASIDFTYQLALTPVGKGVPVVRAVHHQVTDLCACCGVRPADGEVSNTAAAPGRIWEWLEGTRLSSVCADELDARTMAARVRARMAARKLLA